ncbi:hypothetical protein B4123_1134 [Bacillus paralicheniformis]|nr:hypothetical protein B4123_1134 [Bacillus paralicheniformis]TWJ56877.1 hypothetical protein CHCC5023_1122 [Bacillus paralicheniformis]TWJ80634.1 hypothetical protein CHCC5019_3527 [Bacillus paralicheniformis]
MVPVVCHNKDKVAHCTDSAIVIPFQLGDIFICFRRNGNCQHITGRLQPLFQQAEKT